MSSFIKRAVQKSCCSKGQASVEAAFLLPMVFMLLAVLVQPVCFLYTRQIMQSTAAETCRAALTARTEDEIDLCRSFALRRLKAIPEISLFHSGGTSDWKVDIRREDEGVIQVDITGHIRPLPLFSPIVKTFSQTDDKGVVVHVCSKEKLRPYWLGGDYESWVSIWT